jgi:hypothetical protein
MVAKTALGVFIGGLALYVLIFGPDWVARKRREAAVAKAERALNSFTPEMVVAQCGEPADEVEDLDSDGLAFRIMTFETKYGLKLKLTLLQVSASPKEPWRVSPFDETSQRISAEQAITMLPCLTGGERPPQQAKRYDPTEPNPTRVGGRALPVK